MKAGGFDWLCGLVHAITVELSLSEDLSRLMYGCICLLHILVADTVTLRCVTSSVKGQAATVKCVRTCFSLAASTDVFVSQVCLECMQYFFQEKDFVEIILQSGDFSDLKSSSMVVCIHGKEYTLRDFFEQLPASVATETRGTIPEKAVGAVSSGDIVNIDPLLMSHLSEAASSILGDALVDDYIKKSSSRISKSKLLAKYARASNTDSDLDVSVDGSSLESSAVSVSESRKTSDGQQHAPVPKELKSRPKVPHTPTLGGDPVLLEHGEFVDDSD